MHSKGLLLKECVFRLLSFLPETADKSQTDKIHARKDRSL